MVKKNAPIAVVNVGSFSIKGMVGSWEENSFRIEGLATHNVEAQLSNQSSFEDYLEVIEKGLAEFREGIFKTAKEVHFVLNPTFLMAKIIGMPEFAKGDLQSILKDRLERDSSVANKPNGLGDFKLSNVVYENLKDEDKFDDQSDMAVLAVLCELTLIQALQDLVAKHKLGLGGLWSELAALGGLLAKHDPNAWKGSMAVVNIGHNLTTFQIFSEGRCLFFRPIYTAGQQLTKDVLAITNDDTIDFKQAEELKHKMTLAPQDVDPTSLSPLDALIQTISESAALKEFSLVRKLDISFEYLPGNLKRRIGKLFFTGGTSALKGLLHHIKNNTGLPQGELLSVVDKVKILCELPEEETDSNAMAFGCAAGIAFAIKEKILPELNLVRKKRGIDFKNINLKALKAYAQENKGLVAYAGEGVLAAGIIGWLAFSYHSANAQMTRAQKQLQEMVRERTIPDGMVDAGKDLEEYESNKKTLRFYGIELERKIDWVAVFMAISQKIPPQDISVTRIGLKHYKEKSGTEEELEKLTYQDIGETKSFVEVEGLYLSRNVLDTFLANLRTSDKFRDVRLEKTETKERVGGGQDAIFTLRIDP